jgi:hypothetical protein
MDDSDFTWVEIEVLKNRDRTTAYRGRIRTSDLESILANDYKDPFFKLLNVHWLEEKEDELTGSEYLSYSFYGVTNDLIGLAGLTYLRADAIREISPLDKRYREVFERAKAATKS